MWATDLAHGNIEKGSSAAKREIFNMDPVDAMNRATMNGADHRGSSSINTLKSFAGRRLKPFSSHCAGHFTGARQISLLSYQLLAFQNPNSFSPATAASA